LANTAKAMIGHAGWFYAEVSESGDAS